MSVRRIVQLLVLLVILALVHFGFVAEAVAAPRVSLQPSGSNRGFVARLLLNEVPFPGERGYVSEQNTKGAMLAILWVLHGRIHAVPAGYKQKEIATVETRNITDVITAGGVKGQIDGFYRDSTGNLRTVSRVEKRIKHLLVIAERGKPGRVSRMMNHAQELANAYFQAGPGGPDIFENLNRIRSTKVTGRAYSWMTDQQIYAPGGNYITIPNSYRGSMGGNRFFTLRKDPR